MSERPISGRFRKPALTGHTRSGNLLKPLNDGLFRPIPSRLFPLCPLYQSGCLPTVSETVARETGGKALSVQARLSTKPTAYAAAILPLSRGSVAPVDLRAYRGIRFDVRGGTPALRLEARALGDRRFIAPVDAAPQWRTVEIPFSALQGQPPYRGKGPVAEWKGDDVQQLVFSAGGEAGGKVWFEIDNVGFY